MKLLPALAAALLASLPVPDEKRHVPAVCPVDGTRFTGIEIVLTNQYGGVDADFCPHALKTTPLEFYVWTCPSCGFSGRKKDFEAKLGEDEKKALKEGLKPLEPIAKGTKQADIPGHVKYDLMAQAARLRGLGPREEGKAYLHASWSCRQQGTVELIGFEEWKALCVRYGLRQTPMQIGPRKNRTEFDLKAALRVRKDLEDRQHERGVNRILARYLLAFLHRKHGENAEAERWLDALKALEGENSVVDDAAARMRASIAREREFQKKALAAFAGAHRAGPPDMETTYLLGELCRRTGDREGAAAWFNRVLEGPASEPLKTLARRQHSLLQ